MKQFQEVVDQNLDERFYELKWEKEEAKNTDQYINDQKSFGASILELAERK